GGRFLHASRASITSAVPTTLTLPTHGLDAGAAWLTEQHRYPTLGLGIFQGFWHRELCKFLNLRAARRSERGRPPRPTGADEPAAPRIDDDPDAATGDLLRHAAEL